MAETFNGTRTFIAGASLGQYRFVKINPANHLQVLHCSDSGTSADAPIGVTLNSADSGAPVTVELRSPGRTSKVAALSGFSGTFSGLNVFNGPTGYASEGNPSAGTARGYALTDSTGSGSIVEILWV